MSRTTKTRSAPSTASPFLRRVHVSQVPRLPKPMALICGACGAMGKYELGIVTLDPEVIKSRAPDAFENAVGFTGYFRCRKCDAGGPWRLPRGTANHLLVLTAGAMLGGKDLPVILGRAATFDNVPMRYATDGEAHLKALIEKEPERSFLWVRLGNLYGHGGAFECAEEAYQRALELDPKDIEAHAMLGQLLVETGRSLQAVPNWHAVLRHVRHARHVKKGLRRELARGAIQRLLEAHAESKGQIDLLPKTDLVEDLLAEHPKDEPVVLEMREFDLGDDADLEDLCDMFVEPRPRGDLDLFGPRKQRVLEGPDPWLPAPIRRDTMAIGRNASCPCGSGRKYKKCCARRE